MISDGIAINIDDLNKNLSMLATFFEAGVTQTSREIPKRNIF